MIREPSPTVLTESAAAEGEAGSPVPVKSLPARGRPPEAAARRGGLDPHDLRHTFATWLEDGAVPARVIDELMGHQAGRRGEREGSMIGTRYRHMTEAMQARVVAVIAERLAVALAVMPQMCPKPGSGEDAAC